MLGIELSEIVCYNVANEFNAGDVEECVDIV